MTNKRTELGGGRRSQSRGIETRKRILAITSDCLVKEGLHGLRFAHIAKAAGVPQALMGYHFPSVESLLVELIHDELEKLKDLSVERVEKFSSEPKRALAAYIQAPFDLAAKDARFRAVWTSFYHLATIKSEFADLNAQIRKMGRERILNLITMVLATEGALLRHNQISREDLDQLATSVQGLITGLCQMAFSDSAADHRRLRDLAVGSCFRLLELS